MKRYFEDPARRARFNEILKSWLGTPYRHQCHVKGRGADCSLFIGDALVEAGILTGMSFGYYPRDWHIHGTAEVFLDHLRDNIARHLCPGLSVMELKPEAPVLFGDWAGMAFRSTGVTNHSGIILAQDQMIHAARGQGVSIVSFSDWKKYHTITFRVMEDTHGN